MKSLFLLGITLSVVMVSALPPNPQGPQREPLAFRKPYQILTADFRV